LCVLPPPTLVGIPTLFLPLSPPQVLAQRTYDAQLAGLHWGVSRHTCGYVLQVSGFSQKIDLLLKQVCRGWTGRG
ncbi:unnamed protein product, partial [Scytosiphon promiscuus]